MSLVYKELGELVDFKGGGTPSRNVEEYWGDSIPWATVKDLNEGITLTDTQEFINELGLKNSASNLIPKGSIIIPTRMALGKVVITEIDVAINQDLKAISIKKDSLDPKYLLWFLVSNKENIVSMGKGATVKGITLDQLKAINVPLPPLAEQRRIASILDKADELRQKRQQAIAKLDQLLQATFIDMFGDPVSNPKGWVVADFEENIDFLTGFAFKSAEFQSSGIKLCRGINVLPKKLNWNDTAHWCVNDVEKFKKFKIIKNDILVAMDRPWISSGFKIVMIQDNDPEILLVQRVARLRIKKEFGANFIFQIFSSPKFKEHCRITETTVPHISPTDFRTFKIIKPPHKLIEKYEKIASLIHIQKANMLKADIFDEKLFKSIQNKAFSGTL